MDEKKEQINSILEQVFKDVRKNFGNGSIMRLGDKPSVDVDVISSGSILLDNSVDNRLIIDVMGHTDISCTEGYYHKNRKTLERKSQIISSIPEFKVIKSNQK